MKYFKMSIFFHILKQLHWDVQLRWSRSYGSPHYYFLLCCCVLNKVGTASGSLPVVGSMPALEKWAVSK